MSESPTKPRRSWLRRWTPRLLVAVLTLAVVFIVIVQIVLGSGIPKRIVIAQVQNALGLRVSADSLTTGWFGHTTLRHVTLSLPLAEHAFCEVPELRVDHTNLPMLVLTQSVDINAIELDQPKVTVTQDAAGRWNLQDVIVLLGRIGGGGEQNAPAKKSASIALPKLLLRNGDIDITDNTGRHADLSPLQVSGDPINALAWKYDVSVATAAGTRAQFSGRVAPNDGFAHDVAFDLSNLAPMISPWMSGFDPKAAVAGEWRGAMNGNGLTGRLQLKTLHYQNISAQQGDITISTANGSATITPVQLIVHTGTPVQSVNIHGGSIALDSTSARISQLQLSAVDGRIQLDGAASLADESADLHARWDMLRPAPGVDTTGEIRAAVRRDWPNRRTVKVEAHSNGTAAEGEYAADLNITGTGTTWDQTDWTISAPKLSWAGSDSFNATKLLAHVRARRDGITLTDLAIGDSNDLSGRGTLHFDRANPGRYDWWVYLQGQNWPIPRHLDSKFAFGLNAWGDQNQVRIDRSYAQSGLFMVTADGSYRFELPRPVDLFANVFELPYPTNGGTPYVKGQVRGESELVGTLLPLSLSAAGQLHGENIVLGDRPLDKLDVKYNGIVEPHHIEFDTEELALLGGEWAMHVQANDHVDAPEVVLKVHGLPLAEVGKLLRQDDLAGVAAGSITVAIQKPAIEGIVAKGHFAATGIQARQFRADTLSTDISLRDGRVRLDPVRIQLADGRAQASISTDLSRPELITASLNAAGWPVDVGELHAVVSADAQNVGIDARGQTATGMVQFGAAVNLRDQALVLANGELSVAGRVLNLDQFNAKSLDGTASGSGSYDIDRPLASRGTFRLDNINLGSLTTYGSQFADTYGIINGRLDLAPSNDPRALAPLMLDVALVGTNAGYRTLTFSDAHLPLWIDGTRAVLDGGKIDAAGGNIGLFARASRHGNDSLSMQIESKMTNLDLQQLAHLRDHDDAEKKKTYAGLIDGNVNIVGDPRRIKELFGQATIRVHDSDLGNLGAFAVLYDTMHLGASAGKPIGEGTVEARYDNDTVVVSKLRYFNRGADAYGLVTIGGVSAFPKSTLEGSVVGTLQPLRSIKLPFFADADKIFSVLQSGLTSIVIGGTIEKPSYVPQSAAEIGNAMRSFLLGDVPNPK